MSFNVGKLVTRLPFSDEGILVNSGTGPIHVGTRPDILQIMGFTLQPLAYLHISADTTYYAQADVDGTPVDFLASGLGFTPSPSQVTSILNTQTLATQIGAAVPVPPSALAIGAAVPVPPSAAAIGAAVPVPPTATAIGSAVPQPAAIATGMFAQGARMVDQPRAIPLTTLQAGIETPGFDITDAVSMVIAFNVISPVGCTDVFGELVVRWYTDAAATQLVSLDVYETGIVAGNTAIATAQHAQLTSSACYIRCAAVGSFVTFQLNGKGGNDTVQGAINATKSYRPEPVNRFYQAAGADHLLGMIVLSGVAAGQTSTIQCMAPFNGPAEIHGYAQGVTSGSFSYGWGSTNYSNGNLVSGVEFIQVPANGGSITSINPLRCFPRRPMIWRFNNTGTTSSGNIVLYVVATQFA